MKMIVTTIAAATLFSASLSAAEIYHGLGEGNADLSPSRGEETDYVGMQPSVGDSINRYHGFGDGNPDIFESNRSTSDGVGSAGASGNDQAVYVGPGLQF